MSSSTRCAKFAGPQGSRRRLAVTVFSRAGEEVGTPSTRALMRGRGEAHKYILVARTRLPYGGAVDPSLCNCAV